MEYMSYLLIWITEWIILHVMAQMKKECLEAVKIDSFTESQLIRFDQQAVIVQTVDNWNRSFAHVTKRVQISWMNLKFKSVVNNKLI